MSVVTNFCLVGLVGAPLLGWILAQLPAKNSERPVAAIVTAVSLMTSVAWFGLLITWIRGGLLPVEIVFGELWKVGDYTFDTVALVDGASLVFSCATIFLIGMISLYSRYYLHKDSGYRRFFSIMLLFQAGMTLLSVAGNFEIFFAGWECVGLSSFLLIGFYRDRSRPLEAAFQVFRIYRLADVGLLVGAWMTHSLVVGAHSFLEMRSQEFAVGIQALTWSVQILLGLLIILSAAGKSAQFPFSFWVAQAMEGPTPSSAIFYGALSIHAGILLLLRTYPIWHASSELPWIVAGLGGVTAAIAASIGRVQSSVKAQIGYASVAQVGLVFVELAAGFRTFALFHFAANASLRCYQLLVSPSIVAQLLREQAAGNRVGQDRPSIWERRLPQRLRATFYVLVLEEGFLAKTIDRIIWRPLRILSIRVSSVLPARSDVTALGTVLLITLAAVFGSIGLSIAALLFAVFAWGDTRRGPYWNVAWIGLAQGCMAFSIYAVQMEARLGIAIYLGTLFFGWMLTILTVPKDMAKRPLGKAGEFWGLGNKYPGPANFFLLGILILIGAPISPAFVGVDLLFHFGVLVNPLMTFLIPAVFVLSGLAGMRLYTRIFWGEPSSAHHEGLAAQEPTRLG